MSYPIGLASKRRSNLQSIRFGKLLVIDFYETRKGRAFWLCQCDCGSEVILPAASLKSGNTKSCGCLKHIKGKRHWEIHGLSKNQHYDRYHGMIDRCYNEKHSAFADYGGRGIKVCEEWFNDIKAFVKWCSSKDPKPTDTLDRVDNNGPYSPDNCEFNSRKNQCRNTRRNVWVEYNGKRMLFIELVEKFGVVPIYTARCRVARGWDKVRAASTPHLR